ncbi:spore coat protein U domain-containing protein [Ramlibacter sp. AN1133]|uniref:spore coat protein U domain-containing protein n=1 Tax=Ramlibacter sp. AN1133 TaxID=3133429 RepID=UPI0030BAC697
MLNKSSIRAIAAAAMAFFAAGAFAGSDGSTLTVTASVGAKCKVTLSGAMAFGSLDPTLTTDPTATATASYKCTKGTAVTSFGVNSVTTGATGTGGTMTGALASPDTIAYTITWTDPTAFTGDGLGAAGTAKSVTLNGKILNANYVNVKPDSYTGTIGVAVNY